MAIRLNKLSAQEIAAHFDGEVDEKAKFYDDVKRPNVVGKVPGVQKTFSICVDGEGVTIDPTNTNIHKYTELRAGDASGNFKRVINDSNGLSTEKCLWFLFNLPDNAIKVGYYFNYDINMILGDLKLRYLDRLYNSKYKSTKWRGWTLTWMPHKSFSISRVTGLGKKTCTVWDIGTYFQGSFVSSIQKWNVGTDQQVNFIKNMKAERSDFLNVDPNTIADYCALECQFGAQIFEKVLEYTRSIGLRLRRYDGAGSVAAAMLKKHNIQEYMHQRINRLPDEVILSGYHGGRFDISSFGLCGDTIQYDINSAYPYQALHLPCLSCSAWKHTRDFDGQSTWAIWDVSWSLDKYALWSPFPYSRKPGTVSYLRNGRGWYWADEVREAIALYPDAIQVHQGYVLDVQCDHQPFAFVDDYYQYRKQLVREGNLAEKIIKLGLNSLYGKLAQGVGRDDSPPASQCYVWAGIITSNTRAMLLASIRLNPNDAILVATDAVIRRSKTDALPGGGELGQWKDEHMSDLFIVANGVYQAREKAQSGFWVKTEKTRGFAPKFMYDGNVDHWYNMRRMARDSDRFDYAIKRQDFFALGNALNNDGAHMDDWRKWITRPHVIQYGKFKDKDIRDGRLFPKDNPYDYPSVPYEPDTYRVDDAPIVEQLAA